MFSAVLYLFFRTGDESATRELNPVFSLIGPVAGFLSITAAYFLFRSNLKGCRKQNTLYAKLEHYQKAHIFKLALLEAGAILNLILFFISGDLMLLVFGILVVVVMAINYPSIYRVSIDLELNDEEVRLLQSNHPSS